MMVTMRSITLALAVCCTLGCVVNARKVEAPHDDGSAAVMILSDGLLPPLDRHARHAWISTRKSAAREWERWEIWESGTQWGYVGHFPGNPIREIAGDVRVHGVVVGARAAEIIACVERESPIYEWKDDYVPWPGPNSNTYVDVMIRRCDIGFDLPVTAIGKDFRGYVVGASTTEGGTGLQIETPLVGVKAGFKEGIEIHFFFYAFGLDLWPPALLVPFGAGRVGFDDR